MNTLKTSLAGFLVTLLSTIAAAETQQWEIFEVILNGPSHGNPFTSVDLTADFTHAEHSTITLRGFYDGDGTYKIRFMPPAIGNWKYNTKSNVAELNNRVGTCIAIAPTGNNHGPVRVHNTFHFSHADGTPYKPIGTTCYGWTSQSDSLQTQTLETLAGAPFNKIRMCIFPKRYTWNENEPPRYPFAGMPPNRWDFSRFNPEFFRNFERRVAKLRDLGIEADVILFHPYDKGHWGFDRMPDKADDHYLQYAISRLAAYRNVWWSLANEYDFMSEKQPEDWDRLFQITVESDPYNHLRSIHNGFEIYNHNHPWITHASIQNGSAGEDAGRAVLYRDVYRKPVLLDEVKYEGDIPKRWGNLAAEEMVHRFWQATIAGTYATHGECYLHPNETLWWAKGGKLQGHSPARIAFLKEILDSAPSEGLEPIDKWQQTNIVGKPAEYYLIYFGKQTLSQWKFDLPRHELKDGQRFRVDVIDTWNMTVQRAQETFEIVRQSQYRFIDKWQRAVPLPAKPWMGLRITRVAEEHSRE